MQALSTCVLRTGYGILRTAILLTFWPATRLAWGGARWCRRRHHGTVGCCGRSNTTPLFPSGCSQRKHLVICRSVSHLAMLRAHLGKLSSRQAKAHPHTRSSFKALPQATEHKLGPFSFSDDRTLAWTVLLPRTSPMSLLRAEPRSLSLRVVRKQRRGYVWV